MKLNRTMKRVIPLALSASICASAMLTASAETTTFRDVSNNQWYYSFVDKAVNEYGVMTGYGDGLFGPDDALTREQFVTVLASLSGDDLTAYLGYDLQTVFSDTQNDQWYVPYVAWALDNGVTAGIGNGLFGTENPVTREEMAQFIVSYCRNEGISLPVSQVSAFCDDAKISDWAKDAVNTCHAAGIFNGDELGNFNPDSNASRAEAATVFCSLYPMLSAYVVVDSDANSAPGNTTTSVPGETIQKTGHQYEVDHWELLDGTEAYMDDVPESTIWTLSEYGIEIHATDGEYVLVGYDTDNQPIVRRTYSLSSLIESEVGTYDSEIPYYHAPVRTADGIWAMNGGYWNLNGDQRKFYSVEGSYALSGDEEYWYATREEAANAADDHAIEIGCSTGSFDKAVYQIITPVYICSACNTIK